MALPSIRTWTSEDEWKVIKRRQNMLTHEALISSAERPSHLIAPIQVVRAPPQAALSTHSGRGISDQVDISETLVDMDKKCVTSMRLIILNAPPHTDPRRLCANDHLHPRITRLSVGRHAQTPALHTMMENKRPLRSYHQQTLEFTIPHDMNF